MGTMAERWEWIECNVLVWAIFAVLGVIGWAAADALGAHVELAVAMGVITAATAWGAICAWVAWCG